MLAFEVTRHTKLWPLNLRILGILGVFTVFALGGCAAKPPMLSEPITNTWTIDAPLESLWESSISALVDKGVQIDILDRESGLIVGVENFDRGSVNQYVADPYSFAGGQARVNLLFVEKDTNKTHLTIKPTIFGFGRSYYPVKATSNGKLERDYHLLISGSLPLERTYEWLEEEKDMEETN
jgi:hypothetical protein